MEYGKLYIHHKDSIFNNQLWIMEKPALLGVNQKNVYKFKNHKKKTLRFDYL